MSFKWSIYPECGTSLKQIQGKYFLQIVDPEIKKKKEKRYIKFKQLWRGSVKQCNINSYMERPCIYSIWLVLLLIAVNFVFLLMIILTRLLFTTNFRLLIELMFRNWSFMKFVKHFLVKTYIIVPSKKHKISLDVIFTIKNNIILLYHKESLNISLKEQFFRTKEINLQKIIDISSFAKMHYIKWNL